MAQAHLSSSDAKANADNSSYVAASQTELADALSRQHPAHREPLGELLTGTGRLTEHDLHRALAIQQENPNARVGELLLSTGKISEGDLYRALSAKFGVPYVRLGNFDVDPAALAHVPQDIARAYRLLPLMIHRGRLVVAMSNPTDPDARGALSLISRLPIEAVLATSAELELAIATHYAPIDETGVSLEEAPSKQAGESNQDESAEQLAQQQPIVRMVHKVLHDAVQRRASDIHIRPGQRNAQVFYRIDGSLIRIRELPAGVFAAVAARIKVLANLDLAEHRLPQDGAIHLKSKERAIDMRVSVIPSIYGENVVIRVLDPSVGLRRVADIGFTQMDQKRFLSLINRNQGLILVTGPTGSGKTTTLYATLQELNTGEYHILTVEDPVEYRLEGIVQTQVHPTIAYGFSNALRHVLRHDPDVVLIGEIRDTETARIAMESALTGHLVMSTLHTNSATQTITRLLQMNIEPYLLNSTLAGVLAQRLVRRNCEHCKAAESVDDEIREALGITSDEQFFRGTGCTECSSTGYRGRVAVYELLITSPGLRAAVSAGANNDELQLMAVRDGMVPLTQQALALARTGQISLQEVYRARLE